MGSKGQWPLAGAGRSPAGGPGPHRGKPRWDPSGGGAPAFLLAARLAWRQLRHEPARLAAAVSGVVFACLLIFMQLGFLTALFDSAVTVQTSLNADLFLLNRTTEALWRSAPFPRARLAQALALPEVERVIPLYVGNAVWRNPLDGQKRTLLLFGVDPTAGLLGFPGLEPAEMAELARGDVILFDERAKPQFGPVPALLAGRGHVTAELGNRRVEIAGLFALGPTFGTEGHALASEPTFWRILPGRSPAQVDVGAIRLGPGADAEEAARALRALLPEDVMVLTKPGLIAFEKDYWANTAPIGFVFGLGVAIGMLVGCVIVYQILFSDISRHIGEYATLKAMGYSNGYLVRVVMGEALILAGLGYIPGWLLGLGLYRIASAQIFIPLTMDLDKSVLVFALIFLMCVISGLVAIRKLRDADPADMF
jgi:putative ABC transport system permease protein